ncbi:hypothetical protein ILFOPFJJ_01089 [Ensifer psoraleae]|nr:hypothetical protein [Sinorhizobium psoraleae]
MRSDPPARRAGPRRWFKVKESPPGPTYSRMHWRIEGKLESIDITVKYNIDLHAYHNWYTTQKECDY